MILSKQNLPQLPSTIEVPRSEYFDLPEKVLQFGTGVLLRALADFFIDKANKKNIFNGRIVVVKSTAHGSIDAFSAQDALYTLCVKGIEKDKIIDETSINASISRVLAASEQWEEILSCATNENLEIIISNTTEVGLTLLENDNIFSNPPSSFPGKLLSFLHKRFTFFKGSHQSGLVIIPTELIPDNAAKLKNILLRLARQNNLKDEFVEWIENHNSFCNSLVDRIVPGKLNPVDQELIETRNGYQDELMIMAEPYCLWAIETTNESVVAKLSFSQCDKGVVVAPDISKFRELKLRLLNGTHSLNCGLAVIAGFQTVRDAMKNQYFKRYVTHLMLGEIAGSVINDQIHYDEAQEFGHAVIDRFSNPFIEHLWLNITLQYTSKMLMRNVPILEKHYLKTDKPPEYISLGFAGYMLFMKSRKIGDNKFVGNNGISDYAINDDKAFVLNTSWNENDIPGTVKRILADESLWNKNLSLLPGFTDAVTRSVISVMKNGVKETIEELLSNPKASQK